MNSLVIIFAIIAVLVVSAIVDVRPRRPISIWKILSYISLRVIFTSTGFYVFSGYSIFPGDLFMSIIAAFIGFLAAGWLIGRKPVRSQPEKQITSALPPQLAKRQSPVGQPETRKVATSPQMSVFISYRRNTSKFVARAIFEDLRRHGYNVFMDVESIDSGEFEKVILNQVAARAHFIVILTPGTLERCVEPGDWLRREIEHAIDLRRNIVPVLVDNFRFEDNQEYLAGKLSQLPRLNALPVYHEYFEEAMNKLRKRFLKQPVYGSLTPPPPDDEPIVQRKIRKVVSESPQE